MQILKIIRWILFIPTALASMYVAQYLEMFATAAADFYDNFIMKWLIAIAYSFFHPIIIVAVGVCIVPKYKSFISKLMATCLILLYGYIIYSSSKNEHFLVYVSLGLSIIGSIIAFIVIGVNETKSNKIT